ncbi:MAG: bifunctional phosphoribosylaminoimidazolecarboxamide formyltransferase/IMP cyclohydrolase [Armatimonadota bacterium]|nr:bifunctional phosphoribosylaminoimidazolecarboxamide formyltransferase/IMP cyclohydrolase [Armatimonadota bacterium]
MKTTIQRALVSVYDKTGIVQFCQDLHNEGIEIISTGGTASALAAAGLPVLPVETVTGFPEMMDGRVKTLHPAIHGGLLADRSKEEHMRQIAEKNIQPIDLVVINLYPFQETIQRPGATFEDAIENIDIGGPSMIRSAAKNHTGVAVLTDPADYAGVLQEIQEGGISHSTRLRLATKAFRLTSSYDAAISAYLTGQQENEKAADLFPPTLHASWTRAAVLRYGENPHQAAAFYRNAGNPVGLAAMEQLSGKELSYLNLFDVNGALEFAWEFYGQPAAVIVKHASPCGAACGSSTVEAYRRALACDPVSAFGGIVALSGPLDAETAQYMVSEGTFLEVVAAPVVEEEAAELLRTKKKNLRVLRVPYPGAASGGDRLSIRSVRGGVIVQEPDEESMDLASARCVTRRQPTAQELEQLAFAWKVVKHVKSNGIAICREYSAVGIGGGQTDRWRATRTAVTNAGERAAGAVLASDAFFPFPDGPEEAAKAGVTAIVQPGGSIRDAEVIELADKYNLAMLFTGARHFRH